MNPFLSGSREKKFIAIQQCLVPLAKEFNEEQLKQSSETINSLLQNKPVAIRFKIGLFINIINFLSLVLKFKPFSTLDESSKTEILNKFFDSPIGLMRKGFWGINTLAKIGVYTQHSVYPIIGYEPKKVA